MKYFTSIPDLVSLKLREKEALFAAGFIVLLSACSGGGSGGGSGESVSRIAPADPQANGEFSVSSALQSFEAVDADSLTPFVEAELVLQGLHNVHYMTEAQCADSWEVSSFNFDETGSVSAQFCDGTSFYSDYFLDSGVIVLSSITLDGAPIGEGIYEFWGKLADEGVAGGSRACFASLDIDTAASEIPVDPQANLQELLPAIDNLAFDCNVEEYFFPERQDAEKFKVAAGTSQDS